MNYNFDSIAGYEVEKAELQRLCELFNNREEYEKKGGKLPKGIIFYGEPGTGKTLFSKVLADVCGLEVFKIDLGDVENESAICRHIKKTFLKAAKRKVPTMIFFDEMDKVLPNEREEYYTDRSKTILTQLLTLIDGMDSAGNIVFVATCNYYSSLPETLTRPGRLDKKIGLGEPNYQSRVEILNMYASRSSCKFLMPTEEIAKLCVGLSCSAIETLVNECILQSDKDGNVSEELIRRCCREIKEEDIPREPSSVSVMMDAYSNVGSFIVGQVLNGGRLWLSLETWTTCNDFFNGLIAEFDDDYSVRDYDEDDEEYDDCDGDDDCDDCDDEDEECIYRSKADFINAITVLVAPYVTQELVFHKTYDDVACAMSTVDKILMRMAENCMFGLGLRYEQDRHEDLPYPSERIERLNKVFDETIEICYQKAKSILEKNVDLIKKLVSVLLSKQRIEGEELFELVRSLGGIRVEGEKNKEEENKELFKGNCL